MMALWHAMNEIHVGCGCGFHRLAHELYFFFFFFSSRRRHTRLQGDWSSDVCSSDLRSGDFVSDRLEVRVLEGGGQHTDAVDLPSGRDRLGDESRRVLTRGALDRMD